MAMNQKRLDQVFGYTPNTLVASSTFSLNAAANWLAYSFTAQSAKTLNYVRTYVTAVTGVLGANDLSCTLYSDVGGAPSAVIEARNTVTAAPAGAAWVEFTGFTTTLTAGTRYWLVIKNLNGTPAANFPTCMDFTTSNIGQCVLGGSTIGTAPTYSWSTANSTNSGRTWSMLSHNTPGPRLQYSDNTYEGFPTQNTSTADTTAANKQVGVYLVTPNVSLVVAGLTFLCHSTGSPTTDLIMYMYNNTTLVGTTGSIAKALLNHNTGTSWATAFFSSPVTVSPNSIIRATIASVGNDASAYNLPYLTLQNDANSFALMPFQGTFCKTSTIDNGATFTESQTLITGFGLVLDQAAEALFSGMIPIESPVIIPPFRSIGY